MVSVRGTGSPDALRGARDALGDVARVRRDLRSDDPLAHVLRVRKGQVFGGGDVAEEVRPGGRRDRAADGGGDVVVARRDVGGERPEDVEGRSVAHALLDLHLRGHLIQGDVARALDHDLHVVPPGAKRQVPQRAQLGPLRPVARVVQAARPQPVPQRERDVVLPEDHPQIIIRPETTSIQKGFVLFLVLVLGIVYQLQRYV